MEGKEILEIAIPLVGVPAAGVWWFKHHFSDHNHARRILHFKNLDACLEEVDRFRKASDLVIGNAWSLYQNLVHCAQSIEYSMSGYPENKPKIFRMTLGKLVFQQFEKQDYIRHDRQAPIPGATPIAVDGSVHQAADRLSKAVQDFEQYGQDLRPHYAYGQLSKAQYARAHCMHLADHFAMITYG